MSPDKHGEPSASVMRVTIPYRAARGAMFASDAFRRQLDETTPVLAECGHQVGTVVSVDLSDHDQCATFILDLDNVGHHCAHGIACDAALAGDPREHYWTVRDVALYARVTPDTVRVWITNGKLRAYRVGPGLIMVRREDVYAAMKDDH